MDINTMISHVWNALAFNSDFRTAQVAFIPFGFDCDGHNQSFLVNS